MIQFIFIVIIASVAVLFMEIIRVESNLQKQISSLKKEVDRIDKTTEKRIFLSGEEFISSVEEEKI